MQWEDNGQGFLRQNRSGRMAYHSFVPTPLQEVVASLRPGRETMRLVSLCNRKLGELEGMLRFVPNAPMYLTMYVRKEALLSAQIEGAQCTFDDILDPSRGSLAKRDVADVIACVRATEYAVERMKSLPLCMRLLREVHAELLRGTRGGDKSPGEVRTSQNWIGAGGCTLAQAAFVPPNIEDMADALSMLERFINEANGIDPVVKAALVHYQFETIHPFLDGNGRLGRLLITLSLMNDGALTCSAFYPSYQLKLSRAEYYEQLMGVRERGDYLAWIDFFCRCLVASIEDAGASLTQLVELRERNVRAGNGALGGAAHNGQRLLELLEGNPIVDIGFVSERLGVSRTTASSLVKSFVDLGILMQPDDGRKRYRMYLYEDYLGILRRGGEPLG